jgi:succinoglycan biosynthesis protein ExoM
LLRACLESIEGQIGVEKVRVFVADNDPNGREGFRVAAEMAPAYRFPLTAVIVAEPGISAVRNVILDEAAKGGIDFIAMIDDDETASSHWLHHLLAMQARTGADAVGGAVVYRFENPPSEEVANSPAFLRPARPAGTVALLNSTNNVLVSCRSLYKADWPGFDPAFGLTGGGDSEWFFRLARRGFWYAWAPDAIVTETVPPSRATRKWTLRRAYRVGITGIRIAQIHRAWLPASISLAKSTALFVLAPLMAPVLLFPRYRLWLMWKWWRAAGKFAALFGGKYWEYASRH